ncbi:hypothetical protein MTO96_014059 [Rhipicephalus appendiculatus]
MKTMLHIADREYDPFYARLSLSIFGKTVDTFSIDESILSKVQEKAKPEEAVHSLLGADVNKKYFYMTKDMTFIMPSELGVPVFFDFKQVEFMYAKRDKMALNHGDNAEFHLGIKRQYVYDVASYQMVGFAAEFTKQSFGTGHNSRTTISWPLDLKVTFAPLEGKLSLHRPLHLPWNVINHQFRPYTFAMPYDIHADPSHAITEMPKLMKPLYRPEELTEFDRHYFDDTFGVGLKVKGHLIKRGLHQAVREVYHDMSCRERFYYMAINPHWHPRDIRIYALPAAQDPSTELDIDISYKFLEADDERHSHFNVHDQIGDDPEVPSTHVLRLDVNLKGAAKERKAVAELRYSFNHDLFKHKMQFFYEKTPFGHDDTEMKITVNGKFTHTDEDEQNLAAAAEGKTIGRDRFSSTFLHWLANKCHMKQQKGIPFQPLLLQAAPLLQPPRKVHRGRRVEELQAQYCDLQAHGVRTFDGTLIELPETDCFKVVARDCSPSKRFLVLARATSNPSLTKVRSPS